jgi:GrpB-like predicted nucleotidyltransferase (UPF0157 family)
MPPVTIHAYDPEWVERFERARQDIEQALAGFDFRIEHIGSTAVQGLGARNGIDIQIGVTGWAEVDEYVERLRQIGFNYHFTKPGWAHLSGKACKIHIVLIDSPGWTDTLLFRDYLRQHPEALDAYDRLKRDLAREHGQDGGKYVEGKAQFVRSIVEQARQETT